MKFELKHRDDLTIKDFERHNVWVQYYSADEIDHMVKEGYNRKEVEIKLEEVDWSDEYWFKSFLVKKTSPYMFTEYYAQFELPNKKVIKGTMLFTEYSGIQTYSLYVDNEFIGLNVYHSELNEEGEKLLKEKLKIENLYPMIVNCKGIKTNKIFEPK